MTAASTLASVGAFAQAGTSVRLIWWGNPDRDRRTNEVIDLYAKETGTEVVPETYAWNDYWQKLATQAAGQNLPDVIQMDYRFIFEYARRQQLAALDDFVGKQLDLDDFDPNQLASGKVDGKLYGISMGANSMTLRLQPGAARRSSASTLPDPTTWTNDDFVAIGKEVKGKLPEGMYFSRTWATAEPRLETWVRQRGKALYTEDGQLGYELEDLDRLLRLLEGAAGRGPDPARRRPGAGRRAARWKTRCSSPGKSLFDFIHSNQLVANQKLVPDEINITMIPNQKDGKPGQYLKPSMLLSMAETSADKEAAAELMNFFITDPAANDILQIERGVSGDAAVREAICRRALATTEKKIIDYLDIVATSVGPLPPPPPKNAGELDRALRPAWDAISFEQVTVEDGAKEYYDNAVAILARA